MPPNLRKATTGYQYRRIVPAELRAALGKTEIKKNLGSNFKQAKIRLAQLEVETNAAFAAARSTGNPAALTSLEAYLAQPSQSRRLQKISASAPDLANKLASLWLHSILPADLARRRAGDMDDEEFESLDQNIRDVSRSFKQSLSQGNVEKFYPVMSGLLVGKGYQLEGTNQEIQELLFDFLQLAKVGFQVLEQRQNGEFNHLDLQQLSPPLSAVWESDSIGSTQVKEPTWDSLLDYWLKDRDRPQKTQRETTTFLQLFQKHCKKSPADVRKSDITAWLQHQRKEKGNSAVTLEKKGTLLGAVFSASVKDEKLLSNPFAGYDYKRFTKKKGVDDEEARAPFTIDELKRILSPEGIFTEDSRLSGGGGYFTRVWFTLLAYYTGSRLDEIGTMEVSSVLTKDHIAYIRIRQGKNQNSIRDVPLPAELLNLGFLAYVEGVKKAGHDSLWPFLETKSVGDSKSSVFGKWFNHHLRSRMKLPKSKVFHSFRHTFIDVCRNSGMAENLHKSLTGHIAQDVGDKYGQGFKLEVKAEGIRLLKFDVHPTRPRTFKGHRKVA